MKEPFRVFPWTGIAGTALQGRNRLGLQLGSALDVRRPRDIVPADKGQSAL